MRRVAAVAVVMCGLVGVAAPAAADHSWDGWHWKRSSNPLALTIVDSMTGVWDTDLSNVSSDWSASSVVDTSLETDALAEITRLACAPVLGKLRACNAHNPDVTWLGLATVYSSDGTDHIAMATAQVNDFWFDPLNPLAYGPDARRHVLCQEVGHTLGLDHQYSVSCMNDSGQTLGSYTSPNNHDYAQLETIYSHLDPSSSVSAVGPAEEISGSRTTVNVSREGGYTVVQYIIWAV